MLTRRTFLATPLALAAAVGPKPNVVLIVANGWPAQATPWAGDVDVVAPNLARFGKQSITFSRAYACYSRSDRVRPSLLKGIFSHMLAGPDAPAVVLAAEPPSIGTVLTKAGYRTGFFGSFQSGDIVSFVHGLGNAPFYTEWNLDNLGTGLMERMSSTNFHLRENVPAVTQAKAKADLAVFYERAKTRDREIGIVLEALDRPGLADNTIVVFTSDHGEQFGSHGVDGDDFPYEESIRIPLAVRYPRGMRSATPSEMLISQTDIMPTLLRLCGVAPPETVQGRDLSSVLLGGEGERPDTVYAEGRLMQKDEWRMLVHGYDKIVTDLDDVATHLYNLADDPFELNNLATVSSAQLKRDSLIALQKVWTRKLNDGVDGSGLRKR